MLDFSLPIFTFSHVYNRESAVFISLYLYVFIYVYKCYNENNVPSRLSPQWLCGNSCTSAHDVRCFHDNIYITLILLLWDLSALCFVDHLWPLIYMYIYIYALIIARFLQKQIMWKYNLLPTFTSYNTKSIVSHHQPYTYYTDASIISITVHLLLPCL